MTLDTLMFELNQRGVVLQVAGDRIDYQAPAGVLTPELRHQLAAHKPELLAELRKIERPEPAVAAQEAQELAGKTLPRSSLPWLRPRYAICYRSTIPPLSQHRPLQGVGWAKKIPARLLQRGRKKVLLTARCVMVDILYF